MPPPHHPTIFGSILLPLLTLHVGHVRGRSETRVVARATAVSTQPIPFHFLGIWTVSATKEFFPPPC